MATTVTTSPARAAARPLGEHWPLLAGLAVIAVPMFITQGREVWTREIGAHGPIVLATGAWLMWNRVPAMRAAGGRRAPAWLLALMIVPALAIYIFGRAYDFISLEALGVYVIGIAVALRLAGARGVAQNWFPFAYLAFLLPPPGWLIDRITSPLREFVSMVTTDGLRWCGVPISRDGVTLTVAQYQLLVEDACSGMNSLIGLTAVSLLYIYLMHRSSWRYSLLLIAFILPIAVLANILRISVLVLLTYHYGDAVAQGFLHVTAGMVLFTVALVLVFSLDTLLQKLLGGRVAA